MLNERDLKMPDGRNLHVYDMAPGVDAHPLTVFWHHGTPGIGAPPAPLFETSSALNIRWVGLDRPGYGGSTRQPGRTVGSVADDVARVADALGVDHFAVLGHSGGGPHTLACAARLRDRVLAAVSASGLAPFEAAGLDWFAGMVSSGKDELRAATAGPAVLETHLAAAAFDPEMFTAKDYAALSGAWSWFNEVVGPGTANGFAGSVDDDVAYVTPWGFDPAQITAPLLLLHGSEDRIVPVAHAHWLAEHCPTSEIRLGANDGHISILEHAASVLEWLRAQADRAMR